MTDLFMGFTREELNVAFDKVKSKKGWKFPINKVIDAKDIAVVDAAIGYFAGGGACFTKQKPGKFRVSAPGYYMVIGA